MPKKKPVEKKYDPFKGMNKRDLYEFAKNMSTLVSRQALQTALGKQFGGKRDLYEVLGYPQELTFADYFTVYDRDGIASRAADGIAEECWRKPPILWDGDIEGVREKGADISKQTDFLKKFSDLNEDMNFFATCLEADRVLGYSRYAVIYLGAGGKPSEPIAGPVKYFQVFDEEEAKVSQTDLESNKTNPRFGMPLSYEIIFGSDSLTSLSQKVHHSRVIHIREGRQRISRIYGIPRLRKPYNYLMDMEKVIGGSSEAFWLLIRKGLAIMAKDGVDLPAAGTPEYKEMQDEIQEWEHQMRRVLRLRGVDVQDLGTDTVDASGQFGVIVSATAGTIKTPQRILIGSERGELASSQDDANFSDTASQRQTNFCGPYILKPFINVLLDTGTLPQAKGRWSYQFPSLFELNPIEKADIANKDSLTLRNLTDGNPDMVMELDYFMRKYFNYTMPKAVISRMKEAVDEARKLDQEGTEEENTPEKKPKTKVEKLEEGISQQSEEEDA